jgi:CubicO group peptidase (beta-lactamase class C family)
MQLGKRGLAAILALTLATPGIATSARARDLTPEAQPAALGFAPERLDRLTQAFQGYVERGELPGAVVLIARDGRIAYYRAFGHRDAARTQPMTTDAIFRLASMTKPIVSVAAMMLVEENRLDLAAPVERYLPEFKDMKVRTETRNPATGEVTVTLEPQRRIMTVQDLLRHTSGIVYGPRIGQGPVPEMYRQAGIPDRTKPLSAMITAIAQLPLAHQPGEVFEYSLSTDVLGRVIEVVAGMPLDRFVAERVTGPLGMGSTGFSVPAAEVARIAQPLPHASLPAPFDPAVPPVFLSGGGGMVGTAADYLRFAEMLLQGGELDGVRLLAPSTVALMTSNALSPFSRYAPRMLTVWGDIAPTPMMGQGFGLGFAVRTDTGRNPLPGSVGSFYWNGAYGTTFYVDPKERMISIMMIQTPAGAPNDVYRRAMRQLTYQALVKP